LKTKSDVQQGRHNRLLVGSGRFSQVVSDVVSYSVASVSRCSRAQHLLSPLSTTPRIANERLRVTLVLFGGVENVFNQTY
jgi:hypothetical protein